MLIINLLILFVGGFVYFKKDNRFFDLLTLFLLFWVNFPSIGFVLPFIFVFSYLIILSFIEKPYSYLTVSIFALAFGLSLIGWTDIRHCLLFLIPIFFLFLKECRKIKETNLTRIQYAISGISIFSLSILSGNHFVAIIALLGLIGWALTLDSSLSRKVLPVHLVTLVVGAYLLDLSLLYSNLWYLMLSVLFFILGYSLVKVIDSEVRKEREIDELTLKLEEISNELTKVDQSKLGFASIASHQLRTPLTAIKGYLSMIIDGTYGNVSPKVKEKMKNVMESNERLIRLVNELLSLSRIEIGKIKFEPEMLRIEEVIEQSIKDLKIVADKKGLYLRFSKPKIALPETLIDEWKFRQILTNIIDNAIKYTDKGGINVKIRQEDANIKIEISDTGEGMESDELDLIFDLFLRGRVGNYMSPEGSGIGLYIVQKLVELHQGKIWAESKGKNKGSCFHILIPINN